MDAEIRDLISLHMGPRVHVVKNSRTADIGTVEECHKFIQISAKGRHKQRLLMGTLTYACTVVLVNPCPVGLEMLPTTSTLHCIAHYAPFPAGALSSPFSPGLISGIFSMAPLNIFGLGNCHVSRIPSLLNMHCQHCNFGVKVMACDLKYN